VFVDTPVHSEYTARLVDMLVQRHPAELTCHPLSRLLCMALRSACTHTAATASIVDTIIRAYMAADVSREKKSLGSRRMFNLLEKITNRRGSDGKTVGGAGSTAKPSLSSARGACVLRCAVVIHEPCAQRVCAWCVSDSKLYAMVEPLRLACSPGDGMHTQASVDIVRSLLRIDHRAPSVLGNDGKLAIHVCCEVQTHTEFTLDVLRMLIGEFREGVSVRRGGTDKGRLPFHCALARDNHNEVRAARAPSRLCVCRVLTLVRVCSTPCPSFKRCCGSIHVPSHSRIQSRAVAP
jgi:hypothetical protein